MKYVFTGKTIEESGCTLRRIRYLDTGKLGCWIESEANLSQDGRAEVSGNARVFNNARVSGNAKVKGNAIVSEDAQVFENAHISGNAKVFGNVKVFGHGVVSDNAKVYGNAHIYEDARIIGFAEVYGNAHVFGNIVEVSDHAKVYGNIKIGGSKEFCGQTHVNNYFTVFFPKGLLTALILFVQDVWSSIFWNLDWTLSPRLNKLYQKLLEKRVAGTLPDDIKVFYDDYEMHRSEICVDNGNTDGSDYQRLQVVYLTYGFEFGNNRWKDIDEPWHKVLPVFLKTFFKYPVWLRWKNKWMIATGLVHTGDTFKDIIPTVQYLWTLGLEFPVYQDRKVPDIEWQIWESNEGPRKVIVKGCKVDLFYCSLRGGSRMMPYSCEDGIWKYDDRYK
jgi:hypothetical protein